MSQQGIQNVAALLSQMQEARVVLFGGSDQQDILLGRLLEKANDCIKYDFCKITMMEPSPLKKDKP